MKMYYKNCVGKEISRTHGGECKIENENNSYYKFCSANKVNSNWCKHRRGLSPAFGLVEQALTFLRGVCISRHCMSTRVNRRTKVHLHYVCVCLQNNLL